MTKPSNNYEILKQQFLELQKTNETHLEALVEERKRCKDLTRKNMLYESGIAKGINLNKLEKHSLLPVETKMITTLREWASSIENGETRVIQDYQIGYRDDGTLNIKFILRMVK